LKPSFVVAPSRQLFHGGTSHRIMLVGFNQNTINQLSRPILAFDHDTLFFYDLHNDPAWIIEHSTICTNIITNGDVCPVVSAALLGAYGYAGKVIIKTTDPTMLAIGSELGGFITSTSEQTIDVILAQLGIRSSIDVSA